MFSGKTSADENIKALDPTTGYIFAGRPFPPYTEQVCSFGFLKMHFMVNLEISYLQQSKSKTNGNGKSGRRRRREGEVKFNFKLKNGDSVSEVRVNDESPHLTRVRIFQGLFRYQSKKGLKRQLKNL
ncbi:hypothetical protein M9H77_19535 [Catharanthus roseus]|uniref:Uncharacterized protein n=1 Tax=Catharanthus roseus TaxID=4058 RepID=A0ACC0BAP4_CATRO|nr:hypothetical protein M9H77_19535 [Catharanthus roseus]